MGKIINIYSAVTSSENNNDKEETFVVNEGKQKELEYFFAKHGNVDITSYQNPHDDK